MTVRVPPTLRNALWPHQRAALDFPITLLDKQKDPVVKIDFGPPEDRFHMQLAIDAKANYHVTKDKAILAHSNDMGKFGVLETHPRVYFNHLRKADAGKS